MSAHILKVLQKYEAEHYLLTLYPHLTPTPILLPALSTHNLHPSSSSPPILYPLPGIYIFSLLSPLTFLSFSSSFDPSTSCPIITPLSTLIFLRLPNSPAQRCYSAAN